jgi:hypothetical protein
MQVVPEAPIKIFSNDIGSPMSLSGKVDLAVYDQAPFPDDADLRCIIEIKGCKSAWTDFHKDCGRIRQILSETEGKVEFGLFVYVSGLMNSAALKDDFSRFYEITGFDESMVSKIGPYQALRTDQQDCWWQGLVARFGELKGDSVAVVEESLYKD